MEISRAKFLLLASALAASACTVKEKDGDEGSGGSDNSGGRSSGGSSASGGTEAGAGGSGGSGGGTAEAGIPDGGGVDSSFVGEAGTEAGTSVDGGDSGACNDDTGTPADCELVSSAESCGLFGFQSGQCRAAVDYMKPRIAARVTACIVAQTEAQLCDSTNTYGCIDDALKSACPDPTADAPCNDIKAMCPSISVDECTTYLAGMTEEGRLNMYSCMESDCFSIYSCVESI